MTHTAIMSWDGSNRVAKMMDFATEAEADVHVAANVGNYPSAFVVATPNAPVAHWLIDPAGPSVSISAPAPSAKMVQAERERRLALGFAYDFADARGVHQIGTTPEDMAGWDEVTKAANALMALGSGTTTLDVVTATGAATVTAAEWMQILVAAAAHRQPIWQGSFWLQLQDPIPADYASNDAYWSGA